MLLRYYIEIARLNRPIGTVLLFWPCVWGWALAQEKILLYGSYQYLLYFLLGSIALRSCGCIINDIIDRSIDRKILRTRNRPLAANLISIEQAYIALVFFLGVGIFVFFQLPAISKFWAVIGSILMLIYPYCKRYFHYPQVVLGLAFNIGILVAYTCLEPFLTPKILFLFCSGVCWTVAYDTIYAFQDLNDDIKHHIFSTAVRWRDHPKKFVACTYFIGFIFLNMSGGSPFALTSYGIASSCILLFWKPHCIQSCERCFKAHGWLSFIFILR
ncbi:MAG: 4-hydroxybenzoate octaprenyltransferase [Candidatus Puniceispirillum sp.]|nr:4-hydroxybenzoate octaprenyltransferase [Candidatus Pelagibacter sp.]MBA4283665.1 4-hydroxybenzoate octaprenyltransferase [Candidatus Puniceispirillum sp.]